EVVPDRLPESLEVTDRPAPQLLVARQFAAALLLEPTHEGGEVRFPDPRRTRSPQQIALIHHRMSRPLAVADALLQTESVHSNTLDDQCDALAHADAHCAQRVAAASCHQLTGCRGHESRAAHAEGMS